MSQPRAFVHSSKYRPTGINFRALAPADQPFLAGLHASRRQADLAKVDWPEERKAQFLLDELREQEKHYEEHYPGTDRLIVELGTLAIGRVYVQRVEGEIRLLDIALTSRACGCGIGTALIRELIDESRATGARITIHVEPDSAAKRLFARLGFSLLEQREGFDYMTWDPAVS